MKKIRRNDPCPCGSGKKYKKCHGAPNIAQANPMIINQQLSQLHQGLISFVSNSYQQKLEERLEAHSNGKFQKNEDTLNIYQSGLSTWIMTNDNCLPKKQSIFQQFYNQNELKMHHETRRIFRQWKNIAPSIFEVLKIENQKMDILDLLSDKTYTIPTHDGDDYMEGSAIIGTLVPYANFYGFLYSVVKLYRYERDVLKELLQTYSKKQGGLLEHYPAFLAEALSAGTNAIQWDNPSYEEVIQLYAEHMIEKDFKDDTILKGIHLWNEYCDKEKPAVKKIETFAAALEYYVHKHVVKEGSITQGGLAKEYGVSSTTISANYRKLTEVLGQ